MVGKFGSQFIGNHKTVNQTSNTYVNEAPERYQL